MDKMQGIHLYRPSNKYGIFKTFHFGYHFSKGKVVQAVKGKPKTAFIFAVPAYKHNGT